MVHLSNPSLVCHLSTGHANEAARQTGWSCSEHRWAAHQAGVRQDADEGTVRAHFVKWTLWDLWTLLVLASLSSRGFCVIIPSIRRRNEMALCIFVHCSEMKRKCNLSPALNGRCIRVENAFCKWLSHFKKHRFYKMKWEKIYFNLQKVNTSIHYWVLKHPFYLSKVSVFCWMVLIIIYAL